jgi:hypothetical protein
VGTSIFSVVVDLNTWDGTLPPGMLALVPDGSAPPEPPVATAFTADEVDALRQHWDDATFF